MCHRHSSKHTVDSCQKGQYGWSQFLCSITKVIPPRTKYATESEPVALSRFKFFVFRVFFTLLFVTQNLGGTLPTKPKRIWLLSSI